jgi:hypothetical protein
MRRDWTRREEQEATALRLTGLKIAAIARRLDRTPGSVRRRLSQLGVRLIVPRATRPHGRLKPVVAKWLKAGLCVTEIADRLGIGHTYVGVLRKKLGYPPATEREKRARAWVWRKGSVA